MAEVKRSRREISREMAKAVQEGRFVMADLAKHAAVLGDRDVKLGILWTRSPQWTRQ